MSDNQIRAGVFLSAQHPSGANAAAAVLKEVCVAATDEAALETARPYLKAKYDATSTGSEPITSCAGFSGPGSRSATS